MDSDDVRKRFSRAAARLGFYIVLYVGISGVLAYTLGTFLPSLGFEQASNYTVQLNILIALPLGFLIVSGFSNIIYWSVRDRLDHPAASAVRSMFKILGIGALVAVIAGGTAGGAAGVALGGFMGMVIGFASQKVLGQAVAGLFILITRPFKVNDSVNIAGEEGVVKKISTMFTTVTKSDGITVLIPNNSITGGKIYLKSGS